MFYKFGNKITSLLVIGSAVLSIASGIYYFAETNDYEESQFYSMVTTLAAVLRQSATAGLVAAEKLAAQSRLTAAEF